MTCNYSEEEHEINIEFEELGNEAARINRAFGFAPLQGTRKQIIYAEKLRRTLFNSMDTWSFRYAKDMDTVCEYIKNITEASWWIQNKNTTPDKLVSYAKEWKRIRSIK
jgi:hypothetical protein